MNRFLPTLCLFSVLAFGICTADMTVWKGKVDSDGTPTPTVKLLLGKRYQIKASGTMNLGKFRQAGLPLADDACFEFNDKVTPKITHGLQNSIGISVCDGHYHPDHRYQSIPFKAIQSGVHFWIYDTDYNDNHGNLEVEVIQLNDEEQ